MTLDAYTAELHDRALGPVVERIPGIRFVGGAPEPIIHRYVERDGRRWVRAYELERDASHTPLAPHGESSFAYVLSYEGPGSVDSLLEDPGGVER